MKKGSHEQRIEDGERESHVYFWGRGFQAARKQQGPMPQDRNMPDMLDEQ